MMRVAFPIRNAYHQSSKRKRMCDAMTTSIAPYIREQFVRRFPNAAIDVTFHDDETISVRVSSRIEPALAVTYVCDVSSDDEHFLFLNDDDANPVMFPVPDDIV